MGITQKFETAEVIEEVKKCFQQNQGELCLLQSIPEEQKKVVPNFFGTKNKTRKEGVIRLRKAPLCLEKKRFLQRNIVSVTPVF